MGTTRARGFARRAASKVGRRLTQDFRVSSAYAGATALGTFARMLATRSQHRAQISTAVTISPFTGRTVARCSGATAVDPARCANAMSAFGDCCTRSTDSVTACRSAGLWPT